MILCSRGLVLTASLLALAAASCSVQASPAPAATPKVEAFPAPISEVEANRMLRAVDSDSSNVSDVMPDRPVVDPRILAPSSIAPRSPDRYSVDFIFASGSVCIEVQRSVAPHAADRLHQLVELGYFTNVPVFRVIVGRFVQFGLHGDPRVNSVWQKLPIPDDERKLSNLVGSVSFASAGPGTRTTQLVFNLNDNLDFDKAGMAPFGVVVKGLSVLTNLYSEYGDGPPSGAGPDQRDIYTRGNQALLTKYPAMDYVLQAKCVTLVGSKI